MADEIKRYKPTITVPQETFFARLRALFAPKMGPTPIYLPPGQSWGVYRTGADIRLMRSPGTSEFASDAALWVHAWKNRASEPYATALRVVAREDRVEFQRIQRHAHEVLGADYAAGGAAGDLKG